MKRMSRIVLNFGNGSPDLLSVSGSPSIADEGTELFQGLEALGRHQRYNDPVEWRFDVLGEHDEAYVKEAAKKWVEEHWKSVGWCSFGLLNYILLIK